MYVLGLFEFKAIAFHLLAQYSLDTLCGVFWRCSKEFAVETDSIVLKLDIDRILIFVSRVLVFPYTIFALLLTVGTHVGSITNHVVEVTGLVAVVALGQEDLYGRSEHGNLIDSVQMRHQGILDLNRIGLDGNGL